MPPTDKAGYKYTGLFTCSGWKEARVTRTKSEPTSTVKYKE